jgi:hypothetical protein
MPLYRMIIHGRGKLDLGLDEDGYASEAKGFYTTRWCWGSSEKRAQERCKNLLRKEWKSGVLGRLNQGPELVLEIEKIWRIGVFDIWRQSNRGHTFYSESEDAEHPTDAKANT